MGTDGCQSILPNRLRIVSKFKLLGNKVNEVMEIHSAHNFTCPVNTQFSKQSKYDLTQLCLLRIDTTRVINNFDYFAKYRKFPLRKAEENIVQLYKQKHESQTDSIALQQADEALSNASEVDSQTSETDDFDLASDGLEDALELKDDKQDNRHPKRWFGERTQTLLLSSNHFKLSDHSRIKLPPIITPSMVGWSRTKGFSLKARARWDLFTHFSTTLPRMEFTPQYRLQFQAKANLLGSSLISTFLVIVTTESSVSMQEVVPTCTTAVKPMNCVTNSKALKNTIPCFTSSTIMVFTTIAMPTYKPMPVSVCFPD